MYVHMYVCTYHFLISSLHSILYWSNSTDRTLNKLSLNNPNYPSSVININRRVVIQYLTFERENNLLFWFDRLSDSIEMLQLDGKILRTVTDVLNATHVTGKCFTSFQFSYFIPSTPLIAVV